MFTQGPGRLARSALMPPEPFTIGPPDPTGDDLADGAGPVTVTILTSPVAPPEVEVAYEGTHPPLELFGHLTALGFGGLVPMPPPATAIDWRTPDPAAGRAFTVAPFPAHVTGRLDVAPEERAWALDATRYLLHRLSGTPAVRAPDPTESGRVGRVDLRGVLAQVGVGTGSGARAGADPGARHEGGRGGPGVDSRAPAGAGAVALEVVVEEASVERARLAVAGLAVVVEEQATSWTTEVRFRGSTTEAHHHGRRLLVEVDEADVDRLRAALLPLRPRAVGRPVADASP